MLGKLAWRNLLAGEHGIRPYLTCVFLSCAAFYSFNTIGEQERLIVGGVSLPSGYAGSLLGLTLFLACVVGLASALMCRSATRNGRRQLQVLRVLGMSPLQYAGLLLMEQGLVALVGIALGDVVGILFSQALVFATAAVLSGRVVAFAPFLSPRAFLVSLLGGLIVFAITLVGTLASSLRASRGRRGGLRRGRRQGMSGHPRIALGVGALCLLASLAMFSAGSVGIGPPAAVMHPLALVVLWLGSILLFRGTMEALAARMSPADGRAAPPRGVSALTLARAVDLARSYSGSFGLAVIGLGVAVFALASAMGVWGASVGELRSAALVGGMGPLSRQSQTSMDSMSYMAGLAAAVLLPMMLALVGVLVRDDIQATSDDYRVLHDLGCSRADIAHSVGVRVGLGFLVPWALGVAVALVLLLAEAPRLSAFGRIRMGLGLVWGSAMAGIVAVACAVIASRVCGRVVERALRAAWRR